MKQLLFSFFIVAVVAISCSQEPEPITTQFSATVSVADSIDQTGDFSGFEFLIFKRMNPADTPDTLFLAQTDTSGFVAGTINTEDEGAYPMLINRNGRNLATVRLLIADGDTIRFQAEFPGLEETLDIDSRETRSMEAYDRVDRGFQRTNRYIVSGEMADSLILGELQKWADLYWSVYEDHTGTFASKFALESAIMLLEKYDRPQMFDKLNQAFEEEMAFGLAITLGKKYVAETEGFDEAVSYMDSVRSITEKEEIRRSVDQAIIKLHLDSTRIDQAKSLLRKYASRYDQDEEPSFWYKNMRYELYELAPGMKAPDFRFVTTEGDTVTNGSLLGTPYVLEFTLMANQLYQQQYDEATVIYQLYAPQGLNYFTLPYDQSPATIIGFFQERNRFWSLADPPSYNQGEMAERFNIKYYPTRVLIDAEGRIHRKYVGEEFDEIISGVTEILNQPN